MLISGIVTIILIGMLFIGTITYCIKLGIKERKEQERLDYWRKL